MANPTAPHTDELAPHDRLRRTVAPARAIPAGARSFTPVGADELRIRAYLCRMGVVL